IDGNATPAASATGTIRDLAATIGVAIGRDIRSNDKPFNGMIDDVRIYDKALNVTDVVNLHGSYSSVNNAPSWNSNPVNETAATEGMPYSSTIADDATDPDGDPLTYSKVSGTAWLSVATDGILSGTPASGDVGANVFTVQVSDGNGGTDTATLNIVVANVNTVPAFIVDPITGSDATEDAVYAGTLAGSATDADGDPLAYSKVSGTVWLSVATDGTLSGTPASGDVGANAFTVQVSDGNGGTDTATLNIAVVAAQTGGLQSHWKLDDGSGLSATDSSGNSHTGTLFNGTVWTVTGFDAGAAVFDGVDDYIGFGTGPSLAGKTDFTLAAWIKTSSATDQMIIQQRDGGYNGEYMFSVNANGTLKFFVYGNGGTQYGFSTAQTVNDGVWHHVVAVRDGANGYIYIDGNATPAASATGTIRDLDATIGVAIGRDIRGNNKPFNGMIDDVRIYDKALNGTDVVDLHGGYNVAPGVRVAEYYLDAGDFSGTNTMLVLNQDLADDYFILVRGSRTGDALAHPDNNYARVASVPGGKGDLPASGAADRIVLERLVADVEWEGVVTVVECVNPTSAAGFKLVDVVETSLTGTSGTDTSVAWSDVGQVVLFGGYRGGGARFTAQSTASRNQGSSVYARLYPSGTSSLNWSRNAAGETLVDAVMTTFVVEWGSEWGIQHVNVAGNNGGDGANAAGEYTTSAIGAVARTNTWVWGTGTRMDAGLGDCAEACLVTLGDGASQNASETTVAVGSEYTDAYDFDVYVLTHPSISVDHRFKADGDATGLDVPVAVDTAVAGARFGWVYNGCNGTGTYHPRSLFWTRYTGDAEVTISRGFDGQNFPAWVQAIDLSGLDN
ncbi:MAG: cadherin-like domain-containing protein, partial [Verrucomicrobia bacterium]|nr:cadherin-like domain-containing protein [Verrucomicrobiota bacterium]